MQLKKRKRSRFLLFSVPVILIFSIIINKPNFSVLEEDLTQKIVSLNPGFSSFISLIDDGIGNNRFDIPMTKKLSLLFYSVSEFIPKVIKYKIITTDRFERLDLSIDFSNYLLLWKIEIKLLTNLFYQVPQKSVHQ